MAVALDPVTSTVDAPAGFGDVYAQVIDRVGPALAVGFDDRGLADHALQRALTRGRQRWSRQNDHGDAVQLIHRDAFTWAMSARWPRKLPDRPGPAIIPAHSDDSLIQGLQQLPIRQRNALLCQLHLDWSLDQVATAHDAAKSTIELRISRALDELGTTTSLSIDELLERLPDAFETLMVPIAELPPLNTVTVRARRRTSRSRISILAFGLLLIGAVGAIVRAAPADEVVDTGIETVDPPRASQAPFAPISDGRGGFVAFGRRAGVISASSDGQEWVETGRLNVDRVDLRLFVERIFRSDGRYVALVDSANGGGISLSGSDIPRIAVSTDLQGWRLLPLDVGSLPQVEGLKPSINLLNAAAAGERILVAISVEHDVDYRSRGLRPADVCTIANDPNGLILHLCDGSTRPIASATSRSEAGLENTYRLYASDAGGPFEQVAIDDTFYPWGLFGYDGRFGLLTESTDALLTSTDGTSWEPLFDLGIDNRLGLASSFAGSMAVISPSSERWASHVLEDGQVIAGELPLTIDPTSIWLKPEFVSGPAGWALFVTTSRPWEQREDDDVAWAVHVDDWVIEQRAGAGSIQLRSTSDSRSYDYTSLLVNRQEDGHPHVDRGMFGGVRLFEPDTGQLLVEVTGQQIRESWVTGEASTDGERAAIERQGWTISGNSRTGPISATGPDGTTVTWEDGFLFANGDVNDGIETTMLDAPSESPLQFFDDSGQLALELALSDLALLDPEPERTSADGIKAFVVFSADGVNWETIWESRANTWYGSIAVGDDEVLVSATGIASEPERVPVGQSDP